MNQLVVVKGAGDLATGIIAKLHNVGYRILALELERPLAIRRSVCFSEAVYEGQMEVEGIMARKVINIEAVEAVTKQGQVAVMADPEADVISRLEPSIVVDATLMKRDITTSVEDGPIVIGVGPGNTVGVHCHAAVESKRGHNLGRVYYEGSPIPNSGIPGIIGGYGQERVIHAESEGTFEGRKRIGDVVKKGEVIAYIDKCQVKASIDGMIRGIIRDGHEVKSGLKIADIDPRTDQSDNCYTISDKARCIAGGVLEAILRLVVANDGPWSWASSGGMNG